MKCPRKFLTVSLALCFAAAVAAWPQSAPGPMPQAPVQPPSQAPSKPASQAPQQPPSDQPPTLRKSGEPSAGPQTPTPPDAPDQPPTDDRAKIKTTVALVVVPVTIKGRGNTLVTGLEKNDFRIFEDGYEQEIAEFSDDPFPLSVAVLFDDDLKRSTEEKVKDTLQAVAGGFGPADEVSLWRFDEVPEQLADFITDNDVLQTQLKRVELDNSFPGVGSVPMTGGPQVNTEALPGPLQVPAMAAGHPNNKHINDAIYEAAMQLRERASDHRKIIFLISDGLNAKNNTHSYDQTLKLLLSSDISVYAVGVGEANLNHGINVLAKYAHSTGGDIFYASNRDDLDQLYPRVTEQARNQYTLAYVSSQTDKSQPYHAIEVRVRRPGLSLNAREGYYPGGKQ